MKTARGKILSVAIEKGRREAEEESQGRRGRAVECGEKRQRERKGERKSASGGRRPRSPGVFLRGGDTA